MFISETERQSMSGGGAERGKQNQKQVPGSELSAQTDLTADLTNHEIMT